MNQIWSQINFEPFTENTSFVSIVFVEFIKKKKKLKMCE